MYIAFSSLHYVDSCHFINIMDEYLASVYYNPANPASFSGPTKLYRVVRHNGRYDISLSDIKEWLQRQEPYTLHRSLKRRFKRNKVIVAGIDDQWDADLIDVANIQKYNDGTRYILLVIDIFSRFLWLRPLKSKQGKAVASAFESILSEGRKPRYIRSDKGQEFRAAPVQNLFAKNKIHHFVTHNEQKANFAERCIKSIKSRMYRYFTYKNTYHYLDILPELAESYNNTYHRSIHMKPSEVSKDNETTLWWDQYTPRNYDKRSKKFKFSIGDRVRISYLRTVFTREYDQKWTGEVFKISSRFHRGGLPVYKLMDYHDEEITGTFYEPELQKVSVSDNALWKIEKILKSRTRKGHKEHFVKWLHWPSKYNSWVKAEELEDI